MVLNTAPKDKFISREDWFMKDSIARQWNRCKNGISEFHYLGSIVNNAVDKTRCDACN